MTTNLGHVSDQAGSGQPVLTIDQLQVTFATDGGDVHAVKDVSLDVKAGEVVAIVGESGSGKTVTAKTILGLLPETAISSGAVVINGNNVISVSKSDAAQDPRPRCSHGVPGTFHSAESGLHRGLADCRRHPRTRRHRTANGLRQGSKQRATEALRKVGIPDPETRVNYYPHQFSGGQKQRVVIAAALALNPG
jgi:peptide/nickel transport system ATP-binding protein